MKTPRRKSRKKIGHRRGALAFRTFTQCHQQGQRGEVGSGREDGELIVISELQFKKVKAQGMDGGESCTTMWMCVCH